MLDEMDAENENVNKSIATSTSLLGKQRTKEKLKVWTYFEIILMSKDDK